MNASAALTQLAKQCAADVWPKLSSDDLLDILDRARRTDAAGYDPDTLAGWVGNYGYAVGEVIVPSTRNGFYYRATVVEDSERSGDTEPTWPTVLGDTWADGGITWVVAGYAYWQETYDLDWATVEAWETKAGLASGAINLSDNGQTINREAVYTHCTQQADRWRRRLYGATLVSRYGSTQTSLVPPL